MRHQDGAHRSGGPSSRPLRDPVPAAMNPAPRPPVVRLPEASKPRSEHLPRGIVRGNLSRRPLDFSRGIDLTKKPEPVVPSQPDHRAKLPASDRIGNRIGGLARQGQARPAETPMPSPADDRASLLRNANSGLADRLRRGEFKRLTETRTARRLDLTTQLGMQQHGDLSRRLHLPDHLASHGGWQHRHCGPVSPLYTSTCFSNAYCGPGYFPGYCWFPHWTTWVNWCWNTTCLPIYDPRPAFCQPIFYDPCVAWIGWDYPAWVEMPVVTCGTWVDVPPVIVSSGLDVQLLAVRFVDPGHPEQQLGPRYRVWFRNNSPVAMTGSFNLIAYASNDRDPGMGLPEAGVRVTGMEAGQMQSVDLRLPFDANRLDRDAAGNAIPFRFLHVVADSHREIPEAFEENNGAVLDRRDILPVDPAVFAVSLEDSVEGTLVSIAGEGFGPEAGAILLNINGIELQPEILGWYDLGVQVRLPALSIADHAGAELVVVRGDRAASNPRTVELNAASARQASVLSVP